MPLGIRPISDGPVSSIPDVVTGVTGTLSVTESGSDTFASTGQVLVQGSLIVTESGSDSFAGVGNVFIQGTLNASETGSDTFSAIGSVGGSITGTLNATEGSDTFSGVGSVPFVGFRETPAGRSRRKSLKRKVFVEKDGEILLFDSPQQAYDYLQSVKEKAVVKSVKTGKKVKKPVEEFKPAEFEPYSFDRIEIPKLQAFADNQRLYVDIENLIKRHNFIRLLELQEMMRDEEDIEMLLLA